VAAKGAAPTRVLPREACSGLGRLSGRAGTRASADQRMLTAPFALFRVAFAPDKLSLTVVECSR